MHHTTHQALQLPPPLLAIGVGVGLAFGVAVGDGDGDGDGEGDGDGDGDGDGVAATVATPKSMTLMAFFPSRLTVMVGAEVS